MHSEYSSIKAFAIKLPQIYTNVTRYKIRKQKKKQRSLGSEAKEC